MFFLLHTCSCLFQFCVVMPRKEKFCFSIRVTSTCINSQWRVMPAKTSSALCPFPAKLFGMFSPTKKLKIFLKCSYLILQKTILIQGPFLGAFRVSICRNICFLLLLGKHCILIVQNPCAKRDASAMSKNKFCPIKR